MLCIWFVILVVCFCFLGFLNMYISYYYSTVYIELFQSNWLFLTLRKTGFLMQVSFSTIFYEIKKKKKVCTSVPGNSLVCTDVSIFGNYFFKLHYWLMWKTTQKQIWCFCASAQYCHNTSLLTADLIKKITMSTQELKKFLEMLAGMRSKFCDVLFHRI